MLSHCCQKPHSWSLSGHSEIYKTLKAEEIPISLSAIKRIGQRFKTTGNVARKKGSGRPKASSCRDDHLLKYTVHKDRKRSLQKLSAEFKTSENKTLSRITITTRLSNGGFVSRRFVKKPMLSQKNIRDRIRFLADYGKFDSEWFSCVEWWMKISVAFWCSREVCSKIWWEIQQWMHLYHC